MTGFGRGVAEHAGTRATVDLRAVNHRFFDLKLRGAPLAPATEDALGHKLRSALERGSVVASIHLAHESRTAARLDPAAARAAHASLVQLAGELGLPPPDLALVLHQPGVLSSAPAEADPEASATAILAAVDAAIAQLAAMRATEGAALASDLAARLAQLAAAHDAIAEHAAQLPAQLQKRLHDRLAKLLSDSPVDPQRLAHEVAMLADRADVSEELVRLASHLDQARALLASPQSAGRRLDFLVQEIGRELNTIGSKSALAEITSIVVDAKATLEKIREQVQNVE